MSFTIALIIGGTVFVSFFLVFILCLRLNCCQRGKKPVNVVRPHVPYPTAQAGVAPPNSQYPQGKQNPRNKRRTRSPRTPRIAGTAPPNSQYPGGNQNPSNQCRAGSPTYPQTTQQYPQGIGTPSYDAPSDPSTASTSQMVGFNDQPPSYDSLFLY